MSTSFAHPALAQPALLASGLNLHAVFDLDALPDDLRAALADCCDELASFRQLILFGHGGRALWQAVSPLLEAADDPIDVFSQQTVLALFAEYFPQLKVQVLYPGDAPVPLQRLGALAGWHHESPFKVGVNAHWGSWFAYRVLLLADSSFDVSQPVAEPAPCASCELRPCVGACPAGAMVAGDFDLQRCVDFRRQEHSPCRDRCLARLACPVAVEHRYQESQLRYHYLRSMRMIERFYG